MAFQQPLDLQNLFINTIAGSVEIFVFIAVLAIAILSARFQMNDMIFIILLLLFGIFFSAYLGGLYLILILFAGIITFHQVSQMFR